MPGRSAWMAGTADPTGVSAYCWPSRSSACPSSPSGSPSSTAPTRAQAAGRRVGFDSTLVRLDTDDGIVGWGEMAPLGSFYDPSFAGGAREGLRILAPLVLGLDPRQHGALTTMVDRHLERPPVRQVGARHGGVGRRRHRRRHAAGRDAGRARRRDRRAVPVGVAGVARRRWPTGRRTTSREGYRRIQVKVGLDPRDDVERMEAVMDVLPAGTVVYADANAAWTPADARLFAARDPPPRLHPRAAVRRPRRQPSTVRAACDRPFVLDESIDSLAALLRAHGDGLIDGITIKIARVGGVSRDPTGARRRRRARPAGDGRGHRRGAGRHGGDRPPVAQHAVVVAHPHGRLPQLGHASPTAPAISYATDGTMTAPTGPGLGIDGRRRRTRRAAVHGAAR